jgi:hypothetical protein
LALRRRECEIGFNFSIEIHARVYEILYYTLAVGASKFVLQLCPHYSFDTPCSPLIYKELGSSVAAGLVLSHEIVVRDCVSARQISFNS